MDRANPPGGQQDPPAPDTGTAEGQHPQPPDWALERARSDLFDVADRAAILARAWEIAGEAQQLEEERHDEYDDPDLGGEA